MNEVIELLRKELINHLFWNMPIVLYVYMSAVTGSLHNMKAVLLQRLHLVYISGDCKVELTQAF